MRIPPNGGEVGGGLSHINELHELGVDMGVPEGLVLRQVFVEEQSAGSQSLELCDFFLHLPVQHNVVKRMVRVRPATSAGSVEDAAIPTDDGAKPAPDWMNLYRPAWA